MLCEKCNLQPASVHLTQLVNGEKTDIYLCNDCASENNISLTFNNLLHGFLNSLYGAPPSGDSASPRREALAGLACGECGLRFESFKKTGKLGCAKCYSHFRSELAQVIKNIQGGNIHEGKFPSRCAKSALAVREAEKLKLRLKRAVEREEFEEAARLRDEIKKLGD
ncbi:MAG: UvrB/UvrC motif-containing protein [Clostridiales bacterium]|jgi:protein arginine kinase activator|nr:UvrB/UvrC motif-containing protein [Clostridiales bacterium]